MKILHALTPLLVACGSLFTQVDKEIAQSNNKKAAAPIAPTAPNLNENPSARGCPGNNGFYSTADFLWWRPDNGFIAYAFKNTNLVSEGFGNSVSISYEWSPGFRVGTGWNTPYDGWDLFLEWSCFENTTRNTVTSPTNALPGSQGLIAVWAVNLLHNLGLAKCNWHVTYNMFDFEMARPYYVSRSFSIHPLFGAEGGWIHRLMRIRYGDLNPSFVNTTSKISTSSRYWGVGPRIGFNSSLLLRSGMEIFGDFATSLLYGRNHGRYRDLRLTNLAEAANIIEAGYLLVTHLQMALGLGWSSCFRNDTLFASLRLGWEVNEFLNMPDFPTISATLTSLTPSTDEDLSLKGLTLSGRLDF